MQIYDRRRLAGLSVQDVRDLAAEVYHQSVPTLWVLSCEQLDRLARLLPATPHRPQLF